MVASLMTRLPDIANPVRKPYPSDLSDAEWELLKPLLPPSKGFDHPVEVDFREILNGNFYVQRTGCQWEMLPHDLPPYPTVYRGLPRVRLSISSSCPGTNSFRLYPLWVD
jgi:transposase